GHPELCAQLGVPDAGDGAPLGRALSRVVHRGGDADVCGQGTSIPKGEQVDLGDHAGCGVGADAVDGGERLTDAGLVEAALDVAVEPLDAFAERGDVFAGHPRYLRRGRRPSSSGFGEAFASTGAERTWVLEHRSAAKTEQKPEIGGRPGPLRYRRCFAGIAG